MTFVYTNFKGKDYFIHRRKTKTGKTTFTCNPKLDGAELSIPQGYEMYETPNSQVFCRKKQKKEILNKEVILVDKLIKKLSDIEPIKVDVKKEVLSIWTPDQDIDRLISISSGFDFSEFQGTSELTNQFNQLLEGELGKSALGRIKKEAEAKRRRTYLKMLTFSEELRFTLTDSKERNFNVERISHSGAGRWIYLNSGSLEELVTETVEHLGKDSFFELGF